MIKARVVYTMDHIRQLRRLRSIFSYIIMIGCTLYVLFNFVLILGIPLMCFIVKAPLPDGFWRHMIVISILSAFVVFLDIWTFFLAPWTGFRNRKKKYGDSPIYYELDENGVDVKCQGEGFSDNTAFTYDKLDKAIETKNYFLLCPRRNVAYIIGKHEITEGSVEGLRDLLRLKMGNKFKSKG